MIDSIKFANGSRITFAANKPLTLEELALHSSVAAVSIDGDWYDPEDLPVCDACGEYILELVDGWVCEHCLEDAEADVKHIKQERYANVL